MNKLNLKRSNFESSKNNLNKLLKSSGSEQVHLNKVDSETFFGMFDHTVTGKELNQITHQIQQQFIKTNRINSNFISEMKEVYNALSALDRDYINAIEIAFNNAQTAFDESQIAFEKAVDAYDKSEEANASVRELVKNHDQTIKVLEKFKIDIEKIKYISNIDEIWYKSTALEKSITNFNDVLAQSKTEHDTDKEYIFRVIGNIIEDLEKIIHEHKETFENINFSLSNLEESNKNIELSLNEIEISLNNYQQSIDSHDHILGLLQKTDNKLNKLEHLYDVDSLWEQSKDNKKTIDAQNKQIKTALEFKSNIEKIRYIYNVDILWSDNEKNKNELSIARKKINALEEYNNKTNTKIIFAYLLAGSSIMITLANLLLHYFKVV